MKTVLRGNELFALDDPAAGWVVESGVVALFSAELRDGEPGGPRRYLFSCPPGRTLFGLSSVPQGRQRGVVAVAIDAATLCSVDAASAAPDTLAAWIADWRGCLPDADLPEIAAEATSAFLPEFHRRVIEGVCDLERREQAAERARAAVLAQRTEQATREALVLLGAVLEPQRQPPIEGADLFVALAAVGRALGVTLRPPAAWEESSRADPVETICRASHVRQRKVQLRGSWWTTDAGPLLGFLREGGRPVALLQPRAGRYQMFDPQGHASVPLEEEVAATLEPEAYVLYRPLPERAIRGLELLRFALHGRSGELLAIALTAGAATLLGMFAPQATALLVDQAIPDANRQLVFEIGLGLLAAAVGAAIFSFAQGIAMLRLETAADGATQAAVWDRLLNLRSSFFRSFSTGDLQSRVTTISEIRSYLSGTTLRTLFSSAILLLNLVLLLYYSVTLALIACLVAAISAAVTLILGAWILRCSRQILELGGHFFGLMVQLVNGVAKLRVAAAEERAFARWARDYSRLLRLELRRRTIQDHIHLVNLAVSGGSAVLLYAAASALIQREAGITTGVFLAFHVAYGTFIGAVVNLSNTVTDVLAIAILHERAVPILEAAPEIDEAKTDPGRLAGAVQLEHVVFQYDPRGPLVLDDVSLSAGAGQFIALVGPSGSGKSTVLRLLLGLETPQLGSIHFDGQELSGLDVFAVRRQLGVVLQTGRINAGSIFDNIAAGTRIALNDAWEAARAVGFAEEIEGLPMGLHTVISEGGTNLSGGQRQRLLLARALVHKPRVLLLDEATSALDNRTQAIVSESLEQLAVTRIVVAHRLSTIKRADRIYVVDAGRLSEQGRFDELAAAGGLFSRLMARQSL